ncbi:MAG TPA: DUF4886 domain-containing protein [Abditibacteriaceae bacterium]|jgi:hypothetical protein
MKNTDAAPIRVLFIGNSFTARNDLPFLLTSMAAQAQPARAMESQAILANGASLRQHWNAGNATETIRQRKWDYVVLQEQSTLPMKNATRFHENVRLFHQVIQQCKAETVLYLTWARQNAPETQENLSAATYGIAAELSTLVAPVGCAWQTALQQDAFVALHDKDGSHPSPLGSYLAACVFYATLSGHDPTGLPIPQALNISQDDAALVQQVAWQTVCSGQRLSP